MNGETGRLCHSTFNVHLYMHMYNFLCSDSLLSFSFQRPLKTGSPGYGNLRNDVTSSKLCCKGRDVAEDSQGGACVVCCGSKRCKTCDHIFVGST